MDAAADFLRVSASELIELTALLCGGAPPSISFKPVWKIDGSSSVLEVDVPGFQLEQVFRRTDDGELMVQFHALVLASSAQNQGVGFQLVRNALIAYDHLHVAYAAAYANFDVGGYSWAKLAGAPTSPDIVRRELLERLAVPRIAALFSDDERRVLEAVIRNAQDDTLMFDLANVFTDTPASRSLGKPLLLGFSWDALWVIGDPEQRERTKGALAR